jgi:hypothetical protein
MTFTIAFLIDFSAGILLTTAQLVYLKQVFKKEITPSLLPWLGWAFLLGISFLSQMLEFGWNWVLAGLLFSTIGCFTICVSAFLTKNYVIAKKDWAYLLAGLLCVLGYVLFTNPWLTTISAVIADLILGIPMILKAIKNPHTEKSRAWNIALISWSLTLFTCFDKSLLFALFPLYLFLFNGTMAWITYQKKEQREMI